MSILPPHRLDLAGHRRRNGVVPWVAYHGDDGRDRLIAAVEAADLRGRGGAGFPTAVKLRAARSNRSVVVANGCEGDPLSRKDVVLLTLSPHLVLDGLQLAAHATGALEAVLCVHTGSPALPSVGAALGEREDRVPVRVAEVPRRYVASEETALVRYLTSGDARPLGKRPRPAERGVRGRPTLVSNVETLAQLASVVLLGPNHYRASRTDLVTVTGAVRRPGVVEVAEGTSLAGVLAAAGGEAEPVQAVLAGGTWTADLGSGLSGIAAVYALPARDCGLAYTAKVLAFLAAESARQCGPCTFGLPSIAADFAELVRGGPATARLARRLPLLTGRGACAHPDGAARLAASALAVFDADVRTHEAGGRCRIPAGVA
ncbi:MULTISPECIES: NADH-ubiquinone oxidoreductase-F iron-sulfur binding region domain-containing protein [unclassified Amycolatopsis]|uniref:NADH-ubiquinone oxidoreductase-F iron-sulfur binding region domain-containing protein n=1 Tax=unclassified Amycolatopsis TaxID=2618356 RepID=UPI002876C07A|nr:MULTISPECIES: NADH-ubiquinone oxidoreductase-F iron-sulfur binding region domain-containing protein [unclassified Amycolatopsis]MDS0135633.1 SLBB domain-containing protein [Amycolatopsis sp. 505]MDS0148351.1 SLBB domain-containing protein [Amycolatopsis sp. CM201R]